jgi:CheY-like chemotaxis protein
VKDEGVKMPKKILLVDDSSTVLMMERMILAAESYELCTAANGKQAVERAKIERPDLILMDVVMPLMDGVEACKAIRADEATREIPIIMVTTRGETDSVERGYLGGCNDYVTKPVNANELLTKIRNLLGASR